MMECSLSGGVEMCHPPSLILCVFSLLLSHWPKNNSPFRFLPFLTLSFFLTSQQQSRTQLFSSSCSFVPFFKYSNKHLLPLQFTSSCGSLCHFSTSPRSHISSGYGPRSQLKEERTKQTVFRAYLPIIDEFLLHFSTRSRTRHRRSNDTKIIGF